MPKLVRQIELEDGISIMVEADEDIKAPVTRGGSEGLVSRGGGMDSAIEKFRSVEGTIRAYTNHTLNAFKGIAAANIDKVTLEFGIKIGGEAGIPYITKGTAESNLAIKVECSFPK